MSPTPIPDFSLPGTDNQTFTLSEKLGRTLVIYFYPTDNTPGCTTEAQDFRDLADAFSAAGCEIVGISRDSLRSHENFKAKLALPFELLADTDEAACRLFDVIRLKNMYGKQVRGIERSTFIIDRHGKLCREWRQVKVPGHAQAVLDFIEKLD